jgi:hypothetical protein
MRAMTAARGGDDFERELDRLFGLPLEEFTSARNDLARRLKEAGDDDAAVDVRALVKPTVPVWTINQLGRAEPRAVDALLDAGAALRKAQERADRDVFRDAVAEERRAIEDLTERARALLESAGRAASPAVIERIDGSLLAAEINEQGRSALEAGRLTGELEPAGFEALEGLRIPGRRRSERPGRGQQKHDLTQKVRGLERAAREAERDADRAEAAAAEARRAADRARADVDEARAQLDALGRT